MTDEKEGAGWAAGAKSDAFKAVEASLHIDRSPPNVQPASLVAAMMLAERLPVWDDDTERRLRPRSPQAAVQAPTAARLRLQG